MFVPRGIRRASRFARVACWSRSSEGIITAVIVVVIGLFSLTYMKLV
jgi:hypothetical protein